MARVIKSFEPIIDNNSRVLILGTMPGPESIRKGQYYANPRNQFWKIICHIQDEPKESLSDYQERIEFLKMNGIALWDVLKSCEREGANDSNIRNGKPNNFKSLLRIYPNLRRIFFNGKRVIASRSLLLQERKRRGYGFSNWPTSIHSASIRA